MHAISYMVNPYFVNKVQSGDFAQFNSTFEHVVTAPEQLMKAIQAGFAFTPVFEGGRRIKQNFVEAWHVALDFDTGDANSSLATHAGDPLVKRFASFAYTTPSHTTEQPKSRVVFVFDESITSLAGYEALTAALQWLFPHADKSTKDGLRLFYGSQGCEVWENWQTLTLDNARQIYEAHKRYLNTQRPAVAAPTPTAVGNGGRASLDDCKRLLAKLPLPLPYEDWLRAVAAVASVDSGPAGVQLVAGWCQNHFKPGESPTKVIEKKFRSFNGSISFGSLVHLAQLYG